MIIRTLLIVTLVCLVAPLAGAAVPRTETKPYVAPQLGPAPVGYDLGFVNCPRHQGGTCFFFDGSETSVTVRVDDDAAGPVAMNLDFLDANYNDLDSQLVCPAPSPTYFFANVGPRAISVPAGSYELFVTVLGPATSTALCGHLALPSTGNITATFT